MQFKIHQDLENSKRYSSLSKPFLAYSSNFQTLLTHSIIFKPIPSYFSLFLELDGLGRVSDALKKVSDGAGRCQMVSGRCQLASVRCYMVSERCQMSL